MEQDVIVVAGTATERVVADEVAASLVITTGGRGTTREAAVAELAEASDRLHQLLDGVADRFSSIAADRLDVTAVNEHDPGRGSWDTVGWRAEQAVGVVTDAPGALAELVAPAAAVGAAVRHVRWSVADTNPVHDRLRRAAASDARARVEAYAASLGVTVAGLRWLAEPEVGRYLLPSAGGGGGDVAPMAFERAMAASVPMGADGGDDGEPPFVPTLVLRPPAITCSAEVHVAFATRPDV